MHFAGSVTGCQRCISSDHDQLMASLLEHAQSRLALWLQRALQHGKTGKSQAALCLLTSGIPQLSSCQVSGKLFVSQGYDSTEESLMVIGLR